MPIFKTQWVAVGLLPLVLAVAGSAQRKEAGPSVDQVPQSQDGALVIGTTTLRLGMSKGVVIPELAKQYKLEQVQLSSPALRFSELWTIDSRGSATSVVTVGTVKFNERGILVEATRFWTPGHRKYSAAEIGSAIYGLLSRFVSEGKTACLIDTSQAQLPGPGVTEDRDIYIACGLKRIQIILLRQSGAEDVDVWEVLSDEPMPRWKAR